MLQDELLTRKEVLKALKIKDARTLNHLICEGLPVVMIGRFARFSKSDLEKFVQEHKSVTKKEDTRC